MNKKVFADTRFGRYRKKSKSLDYEKSVRVGEKWLWFSNSASKMGPEFVVRPLFFFLTPIFVGLCYEDVAVPTRKSMTVERLNNICVLSVERDLILQLEKSIHLGKSEYRKLFKSAGNLISY